MLNMGHFILWAHCAYLGEHRRIVVRALRVGIILALVIVLVLSALLFAFVGDAQARFKEHACKGKSCEPRGRGNGGGQSANQNPHGGG